jgi:hypothetical protein
MIRIKKRFLGMFVCLCFYFWSGFAFAGPMEIRISDTAIQSFVESVFPVIFKKDITVLGVFKVPITVQLSNPRTALMSSENNGTKKSFMQINMDYTTAGLHDPNAAVRGQITGNMYFTVSPNHEELVLTMGQSSLQILPNLAISLDSMVKPINIPLFKGYPVKIENREIIAKFNQVEMDVDGHYLVINSDVTFEKPFLK